MNLRAKKNSYRVFCILSLVALAPCVLGNEHIDVETSSSPYGYESDASVIDSQNTPAKAVDVNSLNESGIINSRIELAQFTLPPKTSDGKTVQTMPKRLSYQYGYGSESEIEYTNNLDLDDSLDDEFGSIAPEFNFEITYRPSDWFETTWQVRIDKEFFFQEVDPLILPNGEIEEAEKRRASFLIDQAFIKFKKFAGPLELTIGRINMEDSRHWLYDTSLDLVMLGFKINYFKTEISYSRENLFNGDLISTEQAENINNIMVLTEYRGIEDHKLTVFYLDREGQGVENDIGHPRLLGFRANGNPTRKYGYWLEAGYISGKDEESNSYAGYGFDVGASYRLGGKYNPNFSLAYAYGSGDDPSDNKNTAFRQTGLQSNEAKFSGVSEFLTYGEVLNPELSNLQIFTAGFGFFPANNITVDLVAHKYLLNEYQVNSDTFKLVGTINSDPSRLSKDLGYEFDLIIGMRRAFGIKRLGFDLRTGWFFPGNSFYIDDGNSSYRNSDKGMSAILKFWW